MLANKSERKGRSFSLSQAERRIAFELQIDESIVSVLIGERDLNRFHVIKDNYEAYYPPSSILLNRQSKPSTYTCQDEDGRQVVITFAVPPMLQIH